MVLHLLPRLQVRTVYLEGFRLKHLEKWSSCFMYNLHQHQHEDRCTEEDKKIWQLSKKKNPIQRLTVVVRVSLSALIVIIFSFFSIAPVFLPQSVGREQGLM